MGLPQKISFPQAAFSWLTTQGQQALAQYLSKLDGYVNALGAGTAPTLTNAANDAAAAAAGVQVGQFYRNGSIVQIRVT